MGKRVWILAMVTLVAASMMWNPVSAAEEEMCVPMGKITLTPLTKDAQRVAVEFPHAVHFGLSCIECHHKWDNKAPISGCSATGCHDSAEPLKDKDGQLIKDEGQQIRYFKNAYHQACIGCHKKIKTQNKKIETTKMPGQKLAAVGPTGCNKCHPKNVEE